MIRAFLVPTQETNAEMGSGVVLAGLLSRRLGAAAPLQPWIEKEGPRKSSLLNTRGAKTDEADKAR